MGKRLNIEFNHDLLQKIWLAHGLGRVEKFESPKRGWANKVFMVNDSHVIRFDVIDSDGISRWENEQIAYDLLRGDGIPVPEIVTLDTSKSIAPYYFLIVIKCNGTPIIDSWSALDEGQREKLAYCAGEILATIHGHTFPGYGSLWEVARGGGYDEWRGHVLNYYQEYRAIAMEHDALAPSVLDRLEKIMEKCDPLLESVTEARFVHWDYHFENILQADGEITGVLDFEWALAGDPAWDFKQTRQWAETCPGSNAALYAGYQSQRPLPDDLPVRIALYTLLSDLDGLALNKKTGQAVWEDYERDVRHFMMQLEWLEQNLS